MKKLLLMWAIVSTTLLCLSVYTINCQNKVFNKNNQELMDLRNYYDAAEFLFDDIENENEAYFDGDRGDDYLSARQIIINKYLSTKNNPKIINK